MTVNLTHETFWNDSVARQAADAISLKQALAESLGDSRPNSRDRNTIVAVQWLVAIGTSYLVLSTHGWALADPLAGFLVSIILLSAPALQRIPEDLFEKRLIEPALLVFDTVLILFAIALTGDAPWDLLILFFFCIFVAAIGDSLIHIVVGSLLLSVVFVFFISSKAIDPLLLDPNLWVRIPFMFGISVVYGHLADQVRREKKRVKSLEESEQIKRQLVCSLAHDIKAPLSVISGYAEMLTWSDITPSDKQSCLQRVRENVDRIVKLITGFLDISKLGKFTATDARTLIQINDVITDVMQQQMVNLEKKELHMKLDLEPGLKQLHGDKDQLERVLWNLVDNAFKFTPKGGTVSVISRAHASGVRIQVKDTGPGIPRKDLSGLFSEFKRLDGTADIEGTGLGLFIVKTIVDAHSGSVTVESVEGSGTTFSVTLPSA